MLFTSGLGVRDKPGLSSKIWVSLWKGLPRVSVAREQPAASGSQPARDWIPGPRASTGPRAPDESTDVPIP